MKYSLTENSWWDEHDSLGFMFLWSTDHVLFAFNESDAIIIFWFYIFSIISTSSDLNFTKYSLTESSWWDKHNDLIFVFLWSIDHVLFTLNESDIINLKWLIFGKFISILFANINRRFWFQYYFINPIIVLYCLL